MTKLEKKIFETLKVLDEARHKSNKLLDIWIIQNKMDPIWKHTECPICGVRYMTLRFLFSHIIKCREEFKDLI